MNNTAGPAGLVPKLLVLGIVPRTLINPVDLPEQNMRLEAMRTARDEMRRSVARARLRTVLRTRVPQAADVEVAAGIAVLVFHEKPINWWAGPYPVVKAVGKHVWQDVEGNAELLAMYKVKRYQPSALGGTDGRQG